MARIPDAYDRVEWMREWHYQQGVKQALADKNFDRWRAAREMYMTSCVETFIEESGRPAGEAWSDAEFIAAWSEIVKECQDAFNVAPFLSIGTRCGVLIVRLSSRAWLDSIKFLKRPRR